MKIFDSKGECLVEINDRDLRVFNWFNHMKHMTLIEVRDAFWKGCNPRRAPYRRMLKFMAAGFIAIKKVSTESKDVYIPTRKMVKLLKEENVPYAMNLAKKKEFGNYAHDKGVTSLRILFKHLRVGIWVPERVIRSVKPRGGSPDAALLTRTANCAIEYERSEKKIDRYEGIFKRYKYKEHYDAVLYITESESLIKKLKEKYGQADYVYYITRKELFTKKEEAVFFSRRDGLSMPFLIENALKGNLEDLDRDYLKAVILFESDKNWKDMNPFIPNSESTRKKIDQEDQDQEDEPEGPVDEEFNRWLQKGEEEYRRFEEEDRLERERKKKK